MADLSDQQLLQAMLAGTYSDRVQAYSDIIKKNSAADVPDFKWSLLKRSDLECLVNVLLTDLQSVLPMDVVQSAIGMVGYIMSKPEFTMVLPESCILNVAKAVLNIAKKEKKDKKTIVRVLWGFAMEKYPLNIYKLYCDELVDIVIDALTDQQSSVITYESLRLLHFLIKSLGPLVVEKCVDFYSEVFPCLFHGAPRIRKLALNCTNLLLEQPDTLEVLSGIVKNAIPNIKTRFSPVLCSLVTENCIDGLIIWQVCIRMLDRHLHSGTTLINTLLVVIEKGFKSSESAMRVEAFNCWRCLINNFALDEAVLTSIKRLRLLAAPFMANNAKNEDIANAKLNAWWRLIYAVTPVVVQHFDLLVVPLLQFCFKSPLVTAVSPKTTSLAVKNLAMAGASSPGRIYSGMQLKFVHVFYQLLNAGENVSSDEYPIICTLEKLSHHVITLELYSKHHQLLHICFSETLRSIVAEKCPPRIAHYISRQLMKLLSQHIRKSNVKEGAEVVREMFTVINGLATECSIKDTGSSAVMLEVLAAVVCGDTALPSSTLSSRHYQAGGCAAGVLMRGTLASSLADVLLQPALLHAAHIEQERYLEIWRSILLSCKGDSGGRLSFIQGVCSTLSSIISAHALSSSTADEEAWLGGSSSAAVALAAVWCTMAGSLRHHIQQTQTVDQGDCTEHDFSCVYNVLTLPLQHCTTVLRDLPIEELAHLTEEWKLLYGDLAALSSLSSAAPANIEAEHMGRQVMAVLGSEQLAGPPDMHINTLLLLAEALAQITTHFRYCQLTVTATKGAPSPGKPRPKPAPLLELQTVVESVCASWSRVARLVGQQRRQAAAALTTALQQVLTGVRLSRIMAPLVTAVMETITTVFEVNPAARYGTEVEVPLLDVWELYCTLLEEHVLSRPLAPGTKDRLITFLQTGAQSTNGRVLSRTRRLWPSLEHMRLTMPSDVATALQGDHRDERTGRAHVAGSFMSKGILSGAVASPSRSLAIASAPRAPKQRSVIGQSSSSSLLAMEDKEFVVISSPAGAASRRRVLTPHQQEKLRERRCDIPALYSDLSQQASQSQFFSLHDSTLSSDSKIEKSVTSKDFSGRKSFSGGDFPDMDGIEAMKDEDVSMEEVDVSAAKTNTSDNIVDVTSDADEKNESVIIANPDLNLSQLSSVDVSTVTTCSRDAVDSYLSSKSESRPGGSVTTIPLKDISTTTPASAANVSPVLSNESDDSVNEIPDSQTCETETPRRVSGIFSSRSSLIYSGASPLVSVDPVGTEFSKRASSVPCQEEKTPKRGRPTDAKVAVADDQAAKLCLVGVADVLENDINDSGEGFMSPSRVKGTLKSNSCADEDIVTPNKITRSGRKVVAPKKGMPEPMTPPGSLSSKKNYQKVAMASANTLIAEDSSSGSAKSKCPARGFQKKITDMFSPNSCAADHLPTDVAIDKDDDLVSVVSREKNPNSYSRISQSSLNDDKFRDLLQGHKDKLKDVSDNSEVSLNIFAANKPSKKCSENELLAITNDATLSSKINSVPEVDTELKSGECKIVETVIVCRTEGNVKSSAAGVDDTDESPSVSGAKDISVAEVSSVATGVSLDESTAVPVNRSGKGLCNEFISNHQTQKSALQISETSKINQIVSDYALSDSQTKDSCCDTQTNNILSIEKGQSQIGKTASLEKAVDESVVLVKRRGRSRKKSDEIETNSSVDKKTNKRVKTSSNTKEVIDISGAVSISAEEMAVSTVESESVNILDLTKIINSSPVVSKTPDESASSLNILSESVAEVKLTTQMTKETTEVGRRSKPTAAPTVTRGRKRRLVEDDDASHSMQATQSPAKRHNTRSRHDASDVLVNDYKQLAQRKSAGKRRNKQGMVNTEGKEKEGETAVSREQVNLMSKMPVHNESKSEEASVSDDVNDISVSDGNCAADSYFTGNESSGIKTSDSCVDRMKSSSHKLCAEATQSCHSAIIQKKSNILIKPAFDCKNSENCFSGDVCLSIARDSDISETVAPVELTEEDLSGTEAEMKRAEQQDCSMEVDSIENNSNAEKAGESPAPIVSRRVSINIEMNSSQSEECKSKEIIGYVEKSQAEFNLETCKDDKMSELPINNISKVDSALIPAVDISVLSGTDSPDINDACEVERPNGAIINKNATATISSCYKTGLTPIKNNTDNISTNNTSKATHAVASPEPATINCTSGSVSTSITTDHTSVHTTDSTYINSTSHSTSVTTTSDPTSVNTTSDPTSVNTTSDPTYVNTVINLTSINPAIDTITEPTLCTGNSEQAVADDVFSDRIIDHTLSDTTDDAFSVSLCHASPTTLTTITSSLTPPTPTTTPNSSTNLLPPCPSSTPTDRCRGSGIGLRVSSGGSRAAFMLACAQRRNSTSRPRARARRSSDTPGRARKLGDASPRACDVLDSPTRRSFAPHSPRCTPPAPRRSRILEAPSSDRPWAKHLPSPAASPSSSILKKTLVDSNTKGRRVSFADPPVSESVLIPNDTHQYLPVLEQAQQKTVASLSVRAQKRLDMSRAVQVLTTYASVTSTVTSSPSLSSANSRHVDAASKLTKVVDPATLPQQPSQKSLALLVTSDCPGSDSESDGGPDELDNISCSQGIYSGLAGCTAPLVDLLPSLTSPALAPSLQAVLHSRGLTTVGHLACLTEGDVTGLPIRPPKVVVMVQALRDYDQANSSRTVTTKSTSVTASEEQPPLRSRTPELLPRVEESASDKENQSPPKPLPSTAPSAAVPPEGGKDGSSDSDSNKSNKDASKHYVKRSLDQTSIREVLAEIPVGLDEDSDTGDEDEGELLLNETPKKALEKEQLTWKLNVVKMSENKEKSEAVEEVVDTNEVMEQSSSTNAVEDVNELPKDLIENKKENDVTATSRSFSEDELVHGFTGLSESAKQAVLIRLLPCMRYKHVLHAFTSYLSDRE